MNSNIKKTCPVQLDKFLLQNLNNALDINGETSYTNSFLIRLVKEDLGFFFIPNLPVSYPLDSNLYFQVASIASGILYPYKTLLLQNNAYFVDDPNTARALFFPWLDGIPTRLIVDNIEQFIQKNVN